MSDASKKTAGFVISEQAFKADPAGVVRDAKTAPHVVVNGSDGQPRVVIVRPSKALDLD